MSPQLREITPWCGDRFSEARGIGHTKQLYGHWSDITHHRELFNRSIFAMVDIYNNLPQHAVDAPSVSYFQAYVNHIDRTRCLQGDVAWAASFCRDRTGTVTSLAV